MSIKVKELKTQHPEYNANLCTKYDLLYEGGAAFLDQVSLFLPKRRAEASKLYAERVERAFYVGYVGPVIDYFISNLFTVNPNINDEGAKPKFYDEFLANCDLRGTDLPDFFQKVFTQALIHQASYILVDFPSRPADFIPTNLKEEEELGLARAYLVNFQKKDLIDWQLDDAGNFEWVKFYCCERFKPNFNAKEIRRHKWYIYDKYSYQVFVYDEDPEQKEADDVQVANLVSQGVHATSGRVPIICLDVPKGLWIMNKLASIQNELFNLDNAMAWQQYQAHYAMPVIKLKDGKNFKQKMGEAYFIQLEVEESFEWSEPEGKMMEVGLSRREMLKDEMFRIIHQLSLSIKQTKSQTRQSGNSKQEDRYATEVVLREFGDIVRSAMQRLLEWVSEARKEDIKWDVSGFSTFDTDSATEKLAQVLQLRAINIHSETFNKELEKRVVDFYLEDSNMDKKNVIKKEIESYDFQSLIDDPLGGAFGGGMGGGKPLGGTVPGQTSPAKQGQKPNRTNPGTKNKNVIK